MQGCLNPFTRIISFPSFEFFQEQRWLTVKPPRVVLLSPVIPTYLGILGVVLRLGGEDIDLVQQLLTVDQRVGLLGGFVVDVSIRLRSRIGVFHISKISDGQSAFSTRLFLQSLCN